MGLNPTDDPKLQEKFDAWQNSFAQLPAAEKKKYTEQAKNKNTGQKNSK